MNDPERLALVRCALAIDAGRECNRFGYFNALLSELVLNGWADNHEDVSAAYEAINQCQALLDGLTVAFADELVAQVEAERVALGKVPWTDDEELPL